jgi:hypothetical protein
MYQGDKPEQPPITGRANIQLGDELPEYGLAPVPPRIQLSGKRIVTLFSMAPVAVGAEVVRGGQSYRVKGCAEGVDMDIVGNLFNGYWIEGEEI